MIATNLNVREEADASAAGGVSFRVNVQSKLAVVGPGGSGAQRMSTILAGIKTAAIISIGTATLAAFVGAGGLGEPIITGLTLNDHALILEGAVPAALLAVAVELLFELIERATVPAHLRVS